MSIKPWIKKNFSFGQLIFSISAIVIFVSVLPIVLVVRHTAEKKAASVKDYQERFIIRKFKHIEENASAIRLEELSSSIGIDLVPKGSRPPKTPIESKKKFSEMDRTIRTFLHDQLTKEDSSLDPFPQEILQFYLSNMSNIETIVGFISTNPAPMWSFDPKDVKSQFPNLLGQFGLQRLIALDILYRIPRNEQPQVELKFNAMVRLNQNLFGRPELLSQAIAFSILKLQLGLLRKIPWVFTSIDLQILRQDYRKAYFDAMNHDAIHSTFYILNDESLKNSFPNGT